MSHFLLPSCVESQRNAVINSEVGVVPDIPVYDLIEGVGYKKYYVMQHLYCVYSSD